MWKNQDRAQTRKDLRDLILDRINLMAASILADLTTTRTGDFGDLSKTQQEDIRRRLQEIVHVSKSPA